MTSDKSITQRKPATGVGFCVLKKEKDILGVDISNNHNLVVTTNTMKCFSFAMFISFQKGDEGFLELRSKNRLCSHMKF